MAALYYNIPVKQIVLLPIGGVAQLEEIPEDPKKELVIAAAGPLVNVALAVVLFIAAPLLGQSLNAQSFLNLASSLGVLSFS